MDGKRADTDGMDRLLRHVAICNNTTLPGGRLPFYVSDEIAGWFRPASLPVLLRLGCVQRGAGAAAAPARLQTLARGMADAGLCRWRSEAFDVRAEPGGPVLGVMDRGALPALGVRAAGVHMNGFVRRDGGPWLWVARRAADKVLDPGKLDHVAAGGIPAGLTPVQALVKEAAEEAGVPGRLLADAECVEIIDYVMERPEGLRRDRLYCYDVELPAEFIPEARDGEAAGFELWPLPAVFARVRDTDDFKFNVPLVLAGLFRRLGIA